MVAEAQQVEHENEKWGSGTSRSKKRQRRFIRRRLHLEDWGVSPNMEKGYALLLDRFRPLPRTRGLSPKSWPGRFHGLGVCPQILARVQRRETRVGRRARGRGRERGSGARRSKKGPMPLHPMRLHLEDWGLSPNMENGCTPLTRSVQAGPHGLGVCPQNPGQLLRSLPRL